MMLNNKNIVVCVCGGIAAYKVVDVVSRLRKQNANVIGKITNGIADDIISTSIITTKAPVLIVPAMNTYMFENPIVQNNIEKLGEAIAIIKKKGAEGIINNPEVRNHYVEELSDVLMYFNDMLVSYNITSDEISKDYTDKHNKNMNRGYETKYNNKKLKRRKALII